MSLFTQKNRRKGMTLIELLISLAIIAMMTAIAIPMFSRYQRRASLNTDTESVVQLIEYARTLHNNPDYQRYSSPESSAYIVQISQNGGTYSVNLFSQADQNLIIDSAKLSNYDEIISSTTLFSIYGDPPNERLWSCNYIGSGLDNCPKPLNIRIKVKNSSLQKTIRIHHTNEPFSIEVLDQ